MKGLAKRLNALEDCSDDLSPELKEWLGDPLTDAERRYLAQGDLETMEAGSDEGA